MVQFLLREAINELKLYNDMRAHVEEWEAKKDPHGSPAYSKMKANQFREGVIMRAKRYNAVLDKIQSLQPLIPAL